MPREETSFFQKHLVEKLAVSLETPPPHTTRRHMHGRISLPGKITAVIGMRRAGKTTFLHQVRKERMDNGVPLVRLPYINFEDEKLIRMDASHLGILVEEYYRKYPSFRGKETVTWCFDEIQLVPGWESFLRRLLDSEKVDIFVTGSSAAMLSKEIASSLRGRAWEVVIHPFSFTEVLRHRGESLPDDPGFLTAAERSRMENAFLEYLSSGGFPEAQGIEKASRFQLLKDYVDVAILRDVVERYNVTNIVGLRWLVRHLLGNAASFFSVEKFFNALKSQGIAISKDTVHLLLSYLEDCFLVRTVWMESASERRRMVNPRKSYPIDPGLIPLYDRRERANLGHLLETAVLIELERRKCGITYVRTPEGHEVDFLVRFPSGGTELIQVCADLSDSATAERELRSLEEAGKMYANAKMRLLTLTGDDLPGNVPVHVMLQSAYQWILMDNNGEEGI